MRFRSQTPWWDDPPVAAYSLLRDVLAACAAHGTPTVGTLTVAVVPTRPGFPPDECVRWEFTPPGHSDDPHPGLVR